jgi:molybdopterin-guanine dinucleotide biosynthesis protein A
VLVCALDLPFVSSELVNSLARCDPKGRLAVVASSHGQVQPLLGCYQPKALQPLNRAIVVGEPKVTDVVRSLGPRLLEVVDPDALFNINAPDDLLQAAAMLDLKHRQSASTRR